MVYNKISLVIASVFFIVLGICVFGTTSCSSTNTGSDANDGADSPVSDNLQTVSDDLVPESLDYSQNLASVNQVESLIHHAGETEGDPCAIVDGDLFACQPVLLQLYLTLAKDFLDLTRGIVEETNLATADVPDGESGTVETEDGLTVSYNKTTDTDYSLLLMSGDAVIGHIDINGGLYTLQMDLAVIEPDEEEVPEMIEIVVDYTDDDTWDMTAFMYGMPCNDEDARAPERFRLNISKANGLWTGKAMLYSGRWLYGMAEDTVGNPTCATEESDELSMNFYTDFVGNDTASKASVYLMSRTTSSLDDITYFGMDNLDDNFGLDFDTSEYANPFCNEAGTLDANWNDDCASLDSTIGSAEYGPTSDWVVPSEFYQQEIDLPDSL